MKRYLFTLLALLILLSASASAVTIDEYDLNIDLPEDYSVLTADNISANSELAESLGHSVTSMKQYFSDNSLILFAMNDGNARQLQVFCKETEFSARIEDMSHLSDDDALSLVNRFVTVKTVSDLTLVDMGDTKYYEIMSSGQDSGGKFFNIQYVTVRGGRLYTFSFYDNGESSTDFSQLVSDTMATVQIEGEKRPTVTGAESVTEMIIVFILLLLAAALVIFTLVSLICDLYRKSDNGAHFKISRRK